MSEPSRRVAGGRRALRRRVIGGSIAVALVATAFTSRLPAEAAETGYALAADRAAELVDLVEAAPETFSGVTFDATSGVATVRYPAGSDSARRRVAHLVAAVRSTGATAPAGTVSAGDAGTPRGGRWQIRMAPARYSLRELREVKERITADLSWLPEASTVLTRWVVDPATNTVAVGLTRITPAAVAAAGRTFGDRVRLEVTERFTRTAGRYLDESPFSGGALILTDSQACSTGFAITRTTGTPTVRMMTAGHCASVGDEVTNNRNVSMGTVRTSERTNNGFDRATIGGASYRPFIYTGGPSSTTTEAVTGSVGVLQGMSLCFSGTVSFERCGGVTVVVDGCYFIDNQITCHLAQAETTDGQPLVTHGDSGGPVFLRTNTGAVLVAGMIVGGTATTALFHRILQVMPSGWRLHTA